MNRKKTKLDYFFLDKKQLEIPKEHLHNNSKQPIDVQKWRAMTAENSGFSGAIKKSIFSYTATF